MEGNLDYNEISKAIFCSKPNVPDVNWVVYEKGTLVYYEKTEVDDKDELIRKSNKALDIKVAVGSPSADFTVTRLNVYFPNRPIYAVTYGLPDNMLTIVEDEGENDVLIGLTGRHQRTEDGETKIIVATSKD